MSIPATVGNTVVFALVLENGETDFYPQAEVYASGDTVPTATVDLSHLVKGRYEGSWVPSAVGAYTAQFFTYVDPAHTVESVVYTREAEQVFVTENSADDVAAAITRVLGLVHENAFIDNTVFDASSQLITARLRIFDSKTNAQAATDGGVETAGLVATYTIEADYEAAGRMKQYRMVKE
jgi:hypothetical protein